MYFTKDQPSGGYPDPESVVWLRPEEFNDEMTTFIKDGASANDVR
jgi:hypothetical protein